MIRPDIVIPVYKPDIKFDKLIQGLIHQTVLPAKIILMVTEAVDFDSETIRKRVESILFENKCTDIQLEILSIQKENYDHGGTRNLGVGSLSTAEYFVCMTQDVIPYDDKLLENLLNGFEVDENIGVSYARQLAEKKASFTEKILRLNNYPAEAMLKSEKDIKRLGIKAFMLSNACAMYKRKLYDEMGGFVTDTIFNEDMILGASLIRSGYSIYYCAEAKVYHTHNYDLMTQFKRSFDLAVSQKDYPEVFSVVSSEKEGINYVKKAFRYCLKKKKPGAFVKFVIDAVVRYAGFFMGKRYDKLPEKFVLSCTLQSNYWKKSKNYKID